jgi:hypothetical protein
LKYLNVLKGINGFGVSGTNTYLMESGRNVARYVHGSSGAFASAHASSGVGLGYGGRSQLRGGSYMGGRSMAFA